MQKVFLNFESCWERIADEFFAFLDEGNIVVLLNGFVKKEQKTPMREIEKAKLLMHKYYEARER